MNDFHDLVVLLEQRPDLRAQVRTLVLTEDVLALPGLVSKLGGQVVELAEAQTRTEERLQVLIGRVDKLAADLAVFKRDVGELKGQALEQRYRELAPAYFPPLLRKIRVLSSQELADLVDEAEERAAISESERSTLLVTDAIVRGLRRDDRQEAYLVVEISVTIDGEDVDRALTRAGILSKLTDRPVLPVVAGRSISDRAQQRARERHVWQVLNGTVLAPHNEA